MTEGGESADCRRRDPRPNGERTTEVLVWPAYSYRTANPYAALLYQHMAPLDVRASEWSLLRAAFRRFDIWHIHYADAVVYRASIMTTLYRMATFCGSLLMARARGTRIIWTVHDLGSHDRRHPRIETWFWSFFVPRVDGIICLSENGRDQARAFFRALGDKSASIVSHGHYRDAYPDTFTRDEARHTLGLPREATVMLHFGLIRPYKNVPHLIEQFLCLDGEDSETVLLVAGQPIDGAMRRAVVDAARGARRVRLYLEFIAPERVQLYFKAADLVVLPYRRILNSGTLLLALSFNRPVLVPDLGAMAEQRRRIGSQWIRLFSADLTPGDLAAGINWAKNVPRPPACDLDVPDWPTLAEQTHKAYEELLVSGRARRPHR